MTTAAQIKRLVKPLLERNDDLTLIGPWIILNPVQHVARAILIDRTGEAKRFRPKWGVVDLVEPLEIFPFNWGDRFGHPTHRLWEWTDPTIQAAFIEAVERDVLPLLRPIQTLDDFVTFASSQERFPLTFFHGYHFRKVVVDAARGELDSARSICAELASGRTRWSMPLMREKVEGITKRICPLLTADDRPGLVQLLREWEAYSVKNLGLEALWESTPFPLELQERAEDRA